MPDPTNELDGDAFWRARGRESAAQAAGLRLDAYEQAIVRHVLDRAGRKADVFKVMARGEATIGRRLVTLGLFYEVFQDYPLRLVAAKLKLVDMPLGDLFRRPTSTPVHEAYLEACGRFPAEQAVVLVFPWQGFGMRMVLHTLPREFAEPGKPSRTKLVYAVGRPRHPPTIYTVEDLDGLLDSVDWKGN